MGDFLSLSFAPWCQTVLLFMPAHSLPTFLVTSGQLMATHILWGLRKKLKHINYIVLRIEKEAESLSLMLHRTKWLIKNANTQNKQNTQVPLLHILLTSNPDRALLAVNNVKSSWKPFTSIKTPLMTFLSTTTFPVTQSEGSTSQ